MIRAFILFFVLIFPLPDKAHADEAKPVDFGRFSGDPLGRFLPGGGVFELAEDFSFTDNTGYKVLAPAPYRSNGASIPKFLKSFLGGSFDGAYLNGAIIHDYLCDHRTIDWEEVHMLFYKAMRAGGVGSRQAWVMYQGVYQFGPRWRSKADKAKECKAGAEFNPDKCIMNSAPSVEVQAPPLNRESFDSFLAKLRGEGFAPEAAELEEKVTIQ